MVASTQRQVGAHIARRTVRPCIQHQHVIHIHAHAVINTEDKAVCAGLEEHVACPAHRKEVRWDARIRRAISPIETQQRIISYDRRETRQAGIGKVVAAPVGERRLQRGRRDGSGRQRRGRWHRLSGHNTRRLLRRRGRHKRRLSSGRRRHGGLQHNQRVRCKASGGARLRVHLPYTWQNGRRQCGGELELALHVGGGNGEDGSADVGLRHSRHQANRHFLAWLPVRTDDAEDATRRHLIRKDREIRRNQRGRGCWRGRRLRTRLARDHNGGYNRNRNKQTSKRPLFVDHDRSLQTCATALILRSTGFNSRLSGRKLSQHRACRREDVPHVAHPSHYFAGQARGEDDNSTSACLQLVYT